MALWELLYPENPLATIEPAGDDADVQGWNSDSAAFEWVFSKYMPKTIIEVGSWKGASAIHMAKLAPEADILCVDTWLGSIESWVPERGGEYKDMYDSLRLKHGYPQIYYTFASNVVKHVGRERICPMPMPSSEAARMLAQRGMTADFIYIDGSHAYEDVKRDLRDYWPLVRVGGFLMGDDYAWDDVRKAVHSFFRAVDSVIDGKYIVRKWKDD